MSIKGQDIRGGIGKLTFQKEFILFEIKSRIKLK
jgi:hypothetical protein